MHTSPWRCRHTRVFIPKYLPVHESRRSTGAYLLILYSGSVNWPSKEQATVTLVIRGRIEADRSNVVICSIQIRAAACRWVTKREALSTRASELEVL